MAENNPHRIDMDLVDIDAKNLGDLAAIRAQTTAAGFEAVRLAIGDLSEGVFMKPEDSEDLDG